MQEKRGPAKRLKEQVAASPRGVPDQRSPLEPSYRRTDQLGGLWEASGDMLRFQPMRRSEGVEEKKCAELELIISRKHNKYSKVEVPGCRLQLHNIQRRHANGENKKKTNTQNTNQRKNPWNTGGRKGGRIEGLKEGKGRTAYR